MQPALPAHLRILNQRKSKWPMEKLMRMLWRHEVLQQGRKEGEEVQQVPERQHHGPLLLCILHNGTNCWAMRSQEILARGQWRWSGCSATRGWKKAKKSSRFQNDSTMAQFCSASCTAMQHCTDMWIDEVVPGLPATSGQHPVADVLFVITNPSAGAKKQLESP